MRIAETEAKPIPGVTEEVAGLQAQVALFESRTDASLKGGDIGLWIILTSPTWFTTNTAGVISSQATVLN